MHEDDGDDAVLCPTLNGLKRWQESMGSGSAWDDVTGADLDAEMVEEARKEEIEFSRNMNIEYV